MQLPAIFQVGSLIGIRTENPRVMNISHARVAEMIESGEVDGL